MTKSHRRSAALGAVTLVLGLGIQAVVASAADDREMHRDPHGYTRFDRPAGAEQRPQSADRRYLNHNYEADRTFHIGPYHSPAGWHYRRWHFGEFLPAMFWTEQFYLQDYWLFGLDIPPVGYEWVRFGPDAILVKVNSGEIGQVVYGVFL